MKNNKLRIPLMSILLITASLKAQVISVNEIRQFNIIDSTIITIDGDIVSGVTEDIIGTGGYKIRFRIADDVNSTISQGTFTEIHLISDVIGPVTSTQPLSILDQPVFTTSGTFLDKLNSSSELSTGDIVKASGSINAIDNSMALSRLEYDPSLFQWKLRGFARNINASTFTIGNLTINVNGVTPTNCPDGFIDNVFVSILADPDLSFASGQSLATLTAIECQSADIDEDLNNFIPVVVEGVISEFVDLVSFKINSLTVFFDNSTNLDNGELEHIDLGTKIEVQGILDTNNRLINAQTIRFINHRVKIAVPVEPSNITLNQSIEMMGILIKAIPQTRDDDNIFSSGINGNRQIELRGFVDADGNVFAQRIKDIGEVEPDEAELRGNVTAINQPFITVLGVTIDSTNSLFELDDTPVDITAFFAELQVGMQITIKDAIYEQLTNTLSFGELEIEEQELEDDPDKQLSKQISPSTTRDIIGTGGIGIATITGSEVIFSANFEQYKKAQF